MGHFTRNDLSDVNVSKMTNMGFYIFLLIHHIYLETDFERGRDKERDFPPMASARTCARVSNMGAGAKDLGHVLLLYQVCQQRA